MSRSKNATRADNQQERFAGWIVGFVDGEGCFSLGFVKQGTKKETQRIRRGYKTGYQIFHEFAITQGESSKFVLDEIKEYFGVGRVYINTRYDNHNEHLYRYVVRSRYDLLHTIIPFFRKNQLRTKKKDNFAKFAKCVELIEKDVHLSTQGLMRIAKIAHTMNRKKAGKNLAKILRDHTPTPHEIAKATSHGVKI
jgi:hypothetical protein